MNNLVTKSDLSAFYEKILPYLGGGTKLAGPVGMIISYMGTTAPNGYLACDGSWFDIGDYPKLANWMMEEFESYSYFALSGETVPTGKFKVPDLRGEFLRGTGTNSHANQGSGANVGVHQDGTEIPTIVSSGNNNQPRLLAEVTDQPVFINNKDGAVGNQSTVGFQCYNSSTWTLSDPEKTTHFTSRPTNTSVLYCIKYEEYEGDGAGEVYSTTERVVGKWIDGKPIYQKTVDCGVGPNTSSKSVSVGIENLDAVVDIKAIGIDNVNHSFAMIPYINDNTNPERQLFVSFFNNAINIFGRQYDFSNFNLYVTLQYTKTT